MNDLTDSIKSANGSEVGGVAGVSKEAWSRRLKSELGSDLDHLFPCSDQDVWWIRIHGAVDDASAGTRLAGACTLD